MDKRLLFSRIYLFITLSINFYIILYWAYFTFNFCQLLLFVLYIFFFIIFIHIILLIWFPYCLSNKSFLCFMVNYVWCIHPLSIAIGIADCALATPATVRWNSHAQTPWLQPALGKLSEGCIAHCVGWQLRMHHFSGQLADGSQCGKVSGQKVVFVVLQSKLSKQCYCKVCSITLGYSESKFT